MAEGEGDKKEGSSDQEQGSRDWVGLIDGASANNVATILLTI